MGGAVALIAGWQAKRFVKQETRLWYMAQNAPSEPERRAAFGKMREVRQKIVLAYDTKTGLNRDKTAFFKLLVPEGIMKRITKKQEKAKPTEIVLEPKDIARAKLEAIPGC